MRTVTLAVLNFVFVGVVVFPAPFAYANKIDTIQQALKEQCQIEVTFKRALTLIRPLYLTCVPGTQVSIEMCDVNCLKGSSNIIVGRQQAKKEDSL